MTFRTRRIVSSSGSSSVPGNSGAGLAAFRVGSGVIASCAGGTLHCCCVLPHLSFPLDKQGRPVPTGKVKWYDAAKGFGFLSQEDGEDVYVRSSALPEGVDGLKAGEHKHSPDELHGMVEDMITLLESTVQPELRKGRYPDRKTARRVSEVVKAVARELDS